MIIVDTNVIIAFLLTKGITEKIISQHSDTFITPEHCFKELWEHRDVWNRNSLSEKELKTIVMNVRKLFVYSIPRSVYKEYEKEAIGIIDDKDDVPIVALGLAVENEGIWTYNTKDFMTKKVQANVKVLTTSDVLKLYPVEKNE